MPTLQPLAPHTANVQGVQPAPWNELHHCRQVVDFLELVPGSHGETYEVRYGLLPGDHPFLYGFSCSCPAFTLSRRRGLPCKHIRPRMETRCDWRQFRDGGFAGQRPDGTRTCPMCGGPATTEMGGLR